MNQSPLRIAVLAGGLSHERDISLRSGHRVAQVLKHLGHTVLVLDIDARTIGSLKTFGPDVVWPLVHGGPGEDGGLQNVLISLGLPYVGTHSGWQGCLRRLMRPIRLPWGKTFPHLLAWLIRCRQLLAKYRKCLYRRYEIAPQI